MQNIAVNCQSIVDCAWTPSNLLAFDPTSTLLNPVAGPISVPVSTLRAPRPHLLYIPFTSLMEMWRPQRGPRKDILESFTILCTLAGGDHDIHEIRFVSTFPSRQYTVYRSVRQVTDVLQAIRHTFPHLIVPEVVSEAVGDVAMDVVGGFLKNNLVELCSFYPVLFLLFETSKGESLNFFHQLTVELDRVQTTEAAMDDAVKARNSSGWLGWGSRPKQPTEEVAPLLSVEEMLIFVAEHNADFPAKFKEWFVLSFTRQAQLDELQDRISELASCLSRMEHLTTSVSLAMEEHQRMKEAPSSSTSSPTTSTDGGGSVALRAEAQSCEGASMVLQYLRVSMQSLRCLEMSIVKHFHRRINLERSVDRLQPYSQKCTPLPKGCPAERSSSSFRTLCDFVAQLVARKEKWDACIEEELAKTERQLEGFHNIAQQQLMNALSIAYGD